MTDGVNFTQTRKNGKFSFDINDDAEYVYIVTPSGYAADWSSGVPAFYQSAPGNSRFDFNLIRTGEGDDYHLLAIGDIQARDDNHFAIFAADPISDLKAIGNTFTKPVVGVTLGDVCWDRLQYFSKYKEHIVQVGFPVYPILGNHDHDRVTSGDIGASVTYRKEMGPVNYAFYVGKDIVIGLDNIIFNENRKYIEGYADHVIQWLSSLLKYVPQDADIYIAQHSPLTRWFLNKVIYNSEKILDLVRGHKVIFLSGHSHICNNIDIEKDIVEHNVAALCGTWWDTYHCNDGTPKGYKVYTKQDGKLQWYYKSIGKNKDYQMELYMPGQTVMHPNSIVLNIWDYDPAWKVEWAEDGRPVGSMEQVEDLSPVFIRELYEAYEGRIDQLKVRDYKFPRHNIHYFAATPSQYAEKVTITVESRFGKKWVYNVDMSGYVDVQAHRGGMGLMPENTIAAMKNALDLGVNTLELDLQLSKDGVVVVSHDAYFHYRWDNATSSFAMVGTDSYNKTEIDTKFTEVSNVFATKEEVGAAQDIAVGNAEKIEDVKVGDTITNSNKPSIEPLPGYKPAIPMVYSGIYPVDGAKYDELKEALEKLQINDAALNFEPETSIALGFGFRCGFLGLLHMEIIQERIEREFNLDLVTTAPSVIYKVNLTNGETVMIDNPTNFPDPALILSAEEPVVNASVLAPSDFVGNIMELCQDRRGVFKNMTYYDQYYFYAFYYINPVLASAAHDFTTL